MSVKQVNFGNCVKEFEFPLLRISQNVKLKITNGWYLNRRKDQLFSD